MKIPELLSPVGDFECLKAAVQNGADAVYLGASSFSARASATNFNLEELKNAINYAKLRNVKVYLTLNTLIKNNEFDEAVSIAKEAYLLGVDAIIVQDFGLAKFLIANFKDLPIHASTQMTVHNLEGINILKNSGFSRVVLSRELSIEEIKNITKNSNMEIEVFMHGALCISYSGQCLFSSIIGGRSGNRGKCAQACRLPYELFDNSTCIDKGYLLSPKDLCTLNNLQELLEAGITSFKIEGRMKSPEYVAIVTKTYRKYIDEYIQNKKVNIDLKDFNNLLQVFNRGGFSSGHLLSSSNRDLIFSKKPNNLGIYLGKVNNFNNTKGYITFKLNSTLEIGDKIDINSNIYNVSELMIKNNNVKIAVLNDIVTIGRMKGDINISDSIYKIESKSLFEEARKSFSKDFKKIKLQANIVINNNQKPSLELISLENGFYTNIAIKTYSDVLPTFSSTNALTKDFIINQISKTGSTEYEIVDFNIILDDNLFLSASTLNNLRRNAILELENLVLKNNRIANISQIHHKENLENNNKKISLLLNNLSLDMEYSNILNIDNLYIPLKFFLNNNYTNLINNLCSKFNVYVYLPIIMKNNYLKLFNSFNFNNINIKGFVLSHFSQLELVKKYNFELIANYSFNVFNTQSAIDFKNLNIKYYTISPELSKVEIIDLIKHTSLMSELIVYGRVPLMNLNYCLLGKSNHCYSQCKKLCNIKNNFYIKDRLGYKFEIYSDNIDTLTTIYNSKITSIEHLDINSNSIRIDILGETIDEINAIVKKAENGIKLEGNEYTNGNLFRTV